MALNGFFRRTDNCVDEVANFRLPPSWWSRGYEYAWALQFAAPLQSVADMGCGWMYRPLRDALAEVCAEVYCVDADRRLLGLAFNSIQKPIVANICEEIAGIPPGSLDRVFCISVLEDLYSPELPLLEFKRLLKPGGRIILTFDTPYDTDKPTPKYPGLNIPRFWSAVADAGLQVAGDMDNGHDNLLFHREWNLAVYHAHLAKRAD